MQISKAFYYRSINMVIYPENLQRQQLSLEMKNKPRDPPWFMETSSLSHLYISATRVAIN